MISLNTSLTITLVAVFLSVPFGWFLRNWLGRPSLREKKLESELTSTKQELNNYHAEVNNHFEKTASLFNDLSGQYKKLYQHLLAGSKGLCKFDSKNLLESNEDIQLALKSEHSEYNNLPDHNWHPTYFEARDAKEDLEPLDEDKLEADKNLHNKTQKQTEISLDSKKEPTLRVVNSVVNNTEDLKKEKQVEFSSAE